MTWIRLIRVGFFAFVLFLGLLKNLCADTQDLTPDIVGGPALAPREAMKSDCEDDTFGHSYTWQVTNPFLSDKNATEIFVPLRACFLPESFLRMEGQIQQSPFYGGATIQEPFRSSIPDASGGRLGYHENPTLEASPKKHIKILQKSETLYLHEYVPGPGEFSRNAMKRTIRNMIEKTAIELGIDPFLAVAMGQVESGYNPKAVSPGGAIGVLQLMPQFFCKDFEITQDMLYDPDVNIRVGLTYMKSLLERFKEDIDLSLAAYNAGPRRIVEAGYVVPPIEETRNYVKRVREAMEKAGLDLSDDFCHEPEESSREGL